MNKFEKYVGIDVSSDTLDIALFNQDQSQIVSREPFLNNIDGFESIIKWLKSKGVSKENTIICLEITGVYSEEICYYLFEQGYSVWAEDPHKVNRAFRSQVKNDIKSAVQIAEYCFRYIDLFTAFEPNLVIVEEVKTLLTTREQLVEQKTANKNVLGAFMRKRYKSKVAVNALEQTVDGLEKLIKEIEKELKNLIYNNPKYSNKAEAIDSIPGISLLFVSNFFALTNGFSEIQSAKNFASYLGICPNEYKSGTSVYKKPKSSGFGNDRLRKLLYLASMSVKQYNSKYSNYFEMKVKQGKNGALILNNIANKLIKLVCSISKSGLPFNPLYESIHPKFLKVI
jgi:transposase